MPREKAGKAAPVKPASNKAVPIKTEVASGTAPAPGSTTLNGLHNADLRTMLELVDELQLLGLGTMISLPQLVVCGDQSSGKSSVLEAITEVPFPRNANLCTRFATRIVMRQAASHSICATIVPDNSLPDEDQIKLKEFVRTITDLSKFESLVEDATSYMGLCDVKKAKGTKAADKKKAHAFSRNVLSIDISGPDRRPLTLVDLPGLIQSDTSVQTPEDVRIIHKLVEEYLAEKRTIVLAVVPASNDIANNAIFAKCRKVDPGLTRTLGVITKMDRLEAGSEEEKTWIGNAQNGGIELQLGWYLIKNRSDKEQRSSFAERNQAEGEFFRKGAYAVIPQNRKGIAALRSRISDLVYEDAKKRLPKVRDDIQHLLVKAAEDLQSLGKKRPSGEELKNELLKIGNNFSVIVAGAVNGHYDHPFFRATRDVSDEDDKNLRATAERLQKDFAGQMIKYGHKYILPQADDAGGGPNNVVLQYVASTEPFVAVKGSQRRMSRQEAIKWASDLHAKTRGRELPGNFNSDLIAHLFHEQSENWAALAKEHIVKVDEMCQALVHAAITYVAPKELAKDLDQVRLARTLLRRYRSAQEELDRILDDLQGPVAIPDLAFAADVQARAERNMEAQLEETRRLRGEVEFLQANRTISVPATVESPPRPKQDSAVITASKALEQLVAVYDWQIRIFTHFVTQQVIERHLMEDLATDILSQDVVLKMSPEELESLSKEPEEITRERDALQRRKEILEKSRQAFLKVLNPRAVVDEEVGDEGGREEGPKRRMRVLV